MLPRNQAFTRNPAAFHRLPGPRPHGCHFFCSECFNRIWLGSAAFKLYLLIAWCIGLTGLMLLQKEKPSKGKQDMTNMGLAGCFLTYLLSQIFGLLACVSEIEKIFIPYVIVLAIILILNISLIGVALIHLASRTLDPTEANPFPIDVPYLLLFAVLFLVYNSLCLATVMNLCTKFDRKRLVAERRQREVHAHNLRIYERLVALHGHEQQAITTNVDSPPRYSSLDMKLIESGLTLESPPPGYSQLARIEEEDGEVEEREEEKQRKPSRRALFTDPPV